MTALVVLGRRARQSAHQRPKIEKTRGKYSDSSFENKPIRTALQFLREQEIVHLIRSSIRQFDFCGADNLISDRGDRAFNLVRPDLRD